MIAFISQADLVMGWLLLAVPTAIGFVSYRLKKRKAAVEMGGCLILAMAATLIGAGLLLVNEIGNWRRMQPDKMLGRFLHVEDLSEFRDLRSDFVGGLDYTAWIYFETSPERFRQLVLELGFAKLPEGLPNQGMDWAGFKRAPTLPSVADAVVYHRECPERHDIQYLVTNRAHDCGWFVSLDY